MSWNPDQYLKFAQPRLRLAIDLMARIALTSPKGIFDLGCGTGNMTRLLQARWPDARITGIDSSAAMLEQALANPSGIRWVQESLSDWRPDVPADLVYSNAALHWLPDHDRLFPALFDALAPGGVLAVQMPRNFSAPSNTLIAETVLGGPWRSRLEQFLDALAEPERSAFESDYARRLRPHYPMRPDGKTLFPFRRLFLVAQKST
jgi:trans-aconitate 2-methyltransferase